MTGSPVWLGERSGANGIFGSPVWLGDRSAEGGSAGSPVWLGDRSGGLGLATGQGKAVIAWPATGGAPAGEDGWEGVSRGCCEESDACGSAAFMPAFFETTGDIFGEGVPEIAVDG